MKLYMDLNTGEIYTESEVRKLYEQFMDEIYADDETLPFEDYMYDRIRKGFLKEIEKKGYVVMKKYVVWVTDAWTGASSPMDNIEVPDGYTAGDYVSDCEKNADDDWIEMLHNADAIELEEVAE